MSISVPGQMPAPATTASSSAIPTPTLSPPQLQSQQCYGANDFGSHSDIAGSMQNQGANMVCVHFNQTFTSKSGPVQSNLHSVTNGLLPYHYTVSWIDGCVTTATEQSMSEPLGPDNPSVNCVSLLTGDWQNCKCYALVLQVCKFFFLFFFLFFYFYFYFLFFIFNFFFY
jgi:hypothetical protein